MSQLRQHIHTHEESQDIMSIRTHISIPSQLGTIEFMSAFTFMEKFEQLVRTGRVKLQLLKQKKLKYDRLDQSTSSPHSKPMAQSVRCMHTKLPHRLDRVGNITSNLPFSELLMRGRSRRRSVPSSIAQQLSPSVAQSSVQPPLNYQAGRRLIHAD